jgi:hypothetical protein
MTNKAQSEPHIFLDLLEDEFLAILNALDLLNWPPNSDLGRRLKAKLLNLPAR